MGRKKHTVSSTLVFSCYTYYEAKPLLQLDLNFQEIPIVQMSKPFGTLSATIVSVKSFFSEKLLATRTTNSFDFILEL